MRTRKRLWAACKKEERKRKEGRESSMAGEQFGLGVAGVGLQLRLDFLLPPASLEVGRHLSGSVTAGRLALP